ncbi:hypothetical protein E3T55_10885 [Cryobacterium frigoriphilum]|uniref:Uncharacterized protein n=1 Tax=Cryobacterium frigoriphilum TaxID=1259150 RepID=A0A4R8ZZZ1_9MICO|nr:hypothetical protein [Cryobacterium frigoriphilum]TFD49577.1 hypothetical protein E3T55_10885 [Cryobacterium frigoriphilum]
MFSLKHSSVGGDVNIISGPAIPDLYDAYKDFSQEMTLTAEFVGRGELFAELERFEATHRKGYFRLIADAGLGKTAIAAEVAHRFSCEAFFVNASRNLTTAKQCLGHLCAALITRYSLPYDHLPAIGEDSAFFSRILSLSVQRAEGTIWVVVDGLDESVDSGAGGNVLLLPPQLPPGVFMLVTQRPGSYPLRTSPDTVIHDFVISADSPAERADLRTFLVSQAGRSEILARRMAASTPVTIDTFADDILDASEGNFMFTSFLLADIAEGLRSLDSASLAALPHGLAGYYDEMWRQMAKLAAGDGIDSWRQLYRPIVGLLAVAGEPVGAEWLAALIQASPSDVRRDVLRAWRRFVVVTGEPGQERWRLMHRSFHDFLAIRDELHMPDLHARVAAHFADQSMWADFDGYASRHQIDHLASGGDVDGALALVRSRDWYVRQFKSDPSGGLFRADVIAAGRAAASADIDQMGNGLPAQWLGDEIWMALYADTFVSFLRSVGPRTLRCLVEVGALGDAQALAMLNRDPLATGRGMALVWLADLLRPELIGEALEIALTLEPHDARTRALLELAKRLPDELATEILEAETRAVLVLAERDGETIDELAELVEALPDADLRLDLSRAISVASQDDDAEQRANRLGSMAAGLSKYPDLIEQATVAFRGSLDLSEWLEAYIDLLTFGAADVHPEWVVEALDLARAIDDPARKSATLVAIEPLLVSGTRRVVGAEALASCLQIEDADARLEQLADLLEVDVVSSERGRIIDASLETARQVAEPIAQAEAIGTILPFLPESRVDEYLAEAVANLGLAAPADRANALTRIAENMAVGSRRSHLLDEALVSARELTNDLHRASALMNVAIHMSAHDARSIVVEVAQLPAGLVAVGSTQPDRVDRVLLLAALAQSRDFTGQVEELAMGLVDAEVRPYDRARALTALIPILSASPGAAALVEVRRLIGILDNPAERAELGITMLKTIVSPTADELFEWTIESARDIQPGHIAFTGTVNTESLVVMYESMSPLMGRKTQALLAIAEMDDRPQRRDSLRDEAFEAIFDLPANMQVEAVLAAAPVLTITQCKQLIRDYGLILNDPKRRAFVEAVASIEPNGASAFSDTEDTADTNYSLEQALPTESAGDTTAQPDEREFSVRVVRWRGFEDLYGFNRTPDQIAIDFDIDIDSDIDTTKELEIGLEAIGAWARQLADVGHTQVLDVPLQASEFSTGADWYRAIGALLVRIAELSSGLDAKYEASSIWPDFVPPTVAALLAQYQPASERAVLIGEAVRFAKSITDPISRAMCLATLVGSAGAPHRGDAETALADAIAESRAAERGLYRRLAMYLLRPTRSELVWPRLRLQLAQEMISDTWDRQDLLQNLLEILPTLLNLGGERAADTIAAAVADVSVRWP